MDDEFASIVKGIEEGRVLFDNLTKTVAVRSAVVATPGGPNTRRFSSLPPTRHCGDGIFLLSPPSSTTTRVPTQTNQYTLAHALPELVAVVIHLIFTLPYGLTSLMILRCVDQSRMSMSPSREKEKGG